MAAVVCPAGGVSRAAAERTLTGTIALVDFHSAVPLLLPPAMAGPARPEPSRLQQLPRDQLVAIAAGLRDVALTVLAANEMAGIPFADLPARAGTAEDAGEGARHRVCVVAGSAACARGRLVASALRAACGAACRVIVFHGGCDRDREGAEAVSIPFFHDAPAAARQGPFDALFVVPADAATDGPTAVAAAVALLAAQGDCLRAGGLCAVLPTADADRLDQIDGEFELGCAGASEARRFRQVTAQSGATVAVVAGSVWATSTAMSRGVWRSAIAVASALLAHSNVRPSIGLQSTVRLSNTTADGSATATHRPVLRAVENARRLPPPIALKGSAVVVFEWPSDTTS